MLSELGVQRVAIEQLKPDPDNARQHSRRNLDAIAASLRRFGQRRPIVVSNDLTVVAGNGTVAAALELEWAEVWVTVFPGDANEARAYAIADNRTAELAHWDSEQLLANLDSLDDVLQLAAGYTPEDLTDLLQRFGSAPSLDELAEQYGTPDEAALWPVLRLSLPPALLDRYRALVADLGEDEVAQFGQVVAWAEERKVAL